MENDQISEHEIRVYEAVRENGGWLTAKQVAAAADVADRTARAHCSAMAERGAFEVAKVFGGYRYRIASDFTKDTAGYIAAIEAAKRVMR